MRSIDKLQKARISLILSQPFFATLALRLQYEPGPELKTATVNGRVLRYNPNYIERLSIDEIKGVLAHEVMHVAMLHHTRRNGRDIKLWNKAADYAINPLLIESGFVLTDNPLVSDDYTDMSAEQIYSMLQNIQQDNPDAQCDKPDDTGIGDVTDLPSEMDKYEAEAGMKQALAQAALIAKRQGKLPNHIERFITEVFKPQICWEEALARFITETTKNDYTWKKPSPRYLSIGLYLPSLEKEETGNVILIIDTSASIDEKKINQFGSEAQDITNTFNIHLQVIYVDAMVQCVQDIEPDEPVNLKPKGGGGTDFRPGFNYIETQELQPKAVVYLTDGECHKFPEPPDYPVLWAQFGKAKFSPPFGETIQVV